jgi:hypothetical protein
MYRANSFAGYGFTKTAAQRAAFCSTPDDFVDSSGRKKSFGAGLDELGRNYRLSSYSFSGRSSTILAN